MIYFIQSGESGPVKIGKADDPVSRLSSLQVGSPDQLHIRAVLDVHDSVEGHLHSVLGNCRIRGEWFDTNELIVNIAMATAQAGFVWEPECWDCGHKNRAPETQSI